MLTTRWSYPSCGTLLRLAATVAVALMVAACAHSFTAVYFTRIPAGNDREMTLFVIPANGGTPRVVTELSASNSPIVLDRKPNMLYTSRGGAVLGFDLSDGTVRQVAGSAGPLALTIDSHRRVLYWSDTLEKKVRRCNLDGSGVMDVVVDVPDPRAVAIDEVHDTLFWSRGHPDAGVWRAKADGSERRHIVKALYASTAMAADGREKRLFWFDQRFPPDFSRLVSTDLWGNDTKVLVDGLPHFVEGLALDHAARLVYWIERHPAWVKPAKIRRVSYDGASLQTLYEFPAGNHPDVAWGIALGDLPRGGK